MIAGKVETSGYRHVEPTAGIAGRIGKWHFHPTHGIHHPLESAKINLHVMVDRNPKVIQNRGPQSFGVIGSKGRVDPGFAATGDVHVEVTGE